ncbi:MAG: RodZ domain-containing protein [Candidatus Dormibacteria bacterium]
MLGSTLRQARESRELPLREVEWATRIKADYLQALEDEQFDRLPGAVYARGFLRSYATYLGLDPEPLVAEYNGTQPAAAQIVSTRPAVGHQGQAIAVTPGKLAAAALLVVAVIFSVYVKSQFDRYEANQKAAAASVSPRLAPDIAPASPLPSPSPGVSPSPSATVYTGVEVAIRFDAPTWLRVEVDGKPSDQTGAGGKVFNSGESVTFTGQALVHVRSGKAKDTFVTVNGKDMGAMAPVEAGGIGDKTYQKGQA